jgi:ABC-type multidrug transport system fused ATPase/permease subunit
MNEKLKKLTWKYFWRQKLKEVGLTLLIAAVGIFIPYWIGKFVGLIFNNVDISTKGNSWIAGIFALLVLSLIGYLLYLWIEYNWDKAKNKAIKELKKK